MLAFHGLTISTINIIADAFKQARASAPAVLLVDKLDCVFPARSSEAGLKHPSILSRLLVELDSAREERVALHATTNRLDDLDTALLRRLPLKIELPLPGTAARRSVLEMWIKTKVIVGTVGLRTVELVTVGPVAVESARE
ncbi:hypothetical protein OC845_005130 [Tilletia horrida]|nr:hypothetical protein OC845_005130 [Tilletia horrida]